LLVPLVLAALAPGSSASLRTRLQDARSTLDRLTQQIKDEEQTTGDLTARLAGLDSQIASAQTLVDQTQRLLLSTQQEITDAQTQYAADQERLNSLAREAFMHQGAQFGGELNGLLGSRSLAEAADVIEYTSIVGQADLNVATQVANLKSSLALKAAGLESLSSRRVGLLAQLTAERGLRESAIAQQRGAVQQLDQTRARIVSLVASLTRRLKAQEISQVSSSFQGDAHVTYGRWAGLLLNTMRVPGCRSNMILIVAWQLSEFTQAAWNPLATSHEMPGSTTFNSSGVQNYVSLQQGLQATRDTLEGGLVSHRYGAIVRALSRCADPLTTAQAINASDWCPGCVDGTYVTGNVPKVEANYDLYASL